MILTGIWMYDAIQKEGLREENSIIIRTALAIKESFLNKSIGKQTLVMFIVFFLAGLGFGGVLIEPVAIIDLRTARVIRFTASRCILF